MKNKSPTPMDCIYRPRPLQLGVGILVLVLSLAGALNAAEPAKPAKPPPAPPKKKVSRKLTGAELYALHCNRCHPERYAPERTEAQWKTILLHMRTRANIPAEQARAILKFLQEDSGS